MLQDKPFFLREGGHADPPRQRVELGTHWSLNLGIPLIVVLSVLNLMVSLLR